MEQEQRPDDSDLSVLAYLKRQLSAVDNRDEKAPDEQAVLAPGEPLVPAAQGAFPWLTLSAVIVALLGQLLLEPGANRWALPGLLFFAAAGVLILLASRKAEWAVPIRADVEQGWQLFSGRTWLILPGLALTALSFFWFSGDVFTLLATFAWLAGLGLVVFALRSPAERSAGESVPKPDYGLKHLFQQDRPWLLALLLVGGIVLFFRLFRVGGIPPEMVSAQVDHFNAVRAILTGSRVLAFSNNVVSEPLQYYFAAALLAPFGTQLSFSGLRLAYALAGLFSLLYMFRLGSLLVNRTFGLIAMLLLGLSFWANIQTRATLGASIVLTLLVPALFYLLRSLTRRSLNDFLTASVLAGLGLMTHKVFLVFPLASLVILAIWFWHQRSRENRQALLSLQAIGTLVGSITAVPLLRHITLQPDAYFYPIISRISGQEVALNGNPVLIFLGNMLDALGIANWSNRGAWVDGISLRPGLDLVSGAFFVLGLVMAVVQYRQTRDWKVLVFLLMFPLWLIPSAMSLAFPLENPSLSRAIGALIPCLLLASFGLYGSLAAILAHNGRNRPLWQYGAIGVLAAGLLLQNFQLTFTGYPAIYRQNAWNASAMGAVIRDFEAAHAENGRSWLVAYPYWVDARAVAIEAGRPGREIAISPDALEQSLASPEPKLFLLYYQDLASLDALYGLYPSGLSTTFESPYPEKAFTIFVTSQ